MASGWDPGTKTVIRFNSRNSGPTIWEEDAIAAQAIDPEGHDVNDQTLADSITETLNINGINAMLADLDFGGFKAVGMDDGTAATDGVNLAQLDALEAAVAAAITAAVSQAGGIRWTMHNASGNMALGDRWAGLFFGADITYTLPTLPLGDLPLTGPTDIWILNGDTDSNSNIIVDPSPLPGGQLHVNGVALGSGVFQTVLPGQMAVIVPAGSVEAQGWNMILVNAGTDTPYGLAWNGNTRPPTMNALYDHLQVTGNASLLWTLENSNTTLAWGERKVAFNFAGNIQWNLPASPGALPTTTPNEINVLNRDLTGAGNIVLHPTSGTTVYLNGASGVLDLDVTLAVGEQATILPFSGVAPTAIFVKKW